MQPVLTVLINPVAGREDDFNDWYTNVHIRDVMRFAGSIRVQRLLASAVQLEEPGHNILRSTIHSIPHCSRVSIMMRWAHAEWSSRTPTTMRTC